MTYANLPMTLAGTCNSTDEADEGPGLKRLRRNSNQNTALLFMFFFWKFPYLLHEGCVRPYSGIRIRKMFVANLLAYRDFWANQTLHTLGYLISSRTSRFLAIAIQWKAKQVNSSVNSFYCYHSRIQTRPFVREGVWRWSRFASRCWVKLVTTLTKE